MAGGNGAKSFATRAKKLEAAGSVGKVTSKEDAKKQNEQATAHKCTICLQTFGSTSREAELLQHVESKHAKNKTTVAACFPSFKAPA